MKRVKTAMLLAALTALLPRAGTALASAVRKIESWSREVPITAGSPATAHLFIINPFACGGLLRLFSTHPPMQARVERLVTMARQDPMSLT